MSIINKGVGASLLDVRVHTVAMIVSNRYTKVRIYA